MVFHFCLVLLLPCIPSPAGFVALLLTSSFIYRLAISFSLPLESATDLGGEPEPAMVHCTAIEPLLYT